MSGNERIKLPKKSSNAEVDSFLRKVAATPIAKSGADRGRLIFAMDATASREPTWDTACHTHGQMFQETANLGGLEIQLCYYRGFAEFNAGPWLVDPAALLKRMTLVSCLGGQTQIEKTLRHTITETKKKKVNALVFVGDCMEEDADGLCQLAGELGVLGVPAFLFHEGHDAIAERAFKQIARLSGGAYCHFDSNSAQQLRDLLSAVAVYVAGGRRALADFGERKGGVAGLLTHQIKKG
ncbi:MAG: VWA domain-containing protein [Proteobacteria bacterium]|nr:MAG: VWA domain-containing protein [Pseudomonadota bacterium]TDJ71395.1 MAG: VWA domain-containing protein [Pseudomonadota bacterium]